MEIEELLYHALDILHMDLHRSRTVGGIQHEKSGALIQEK